MNARQSAMLTAGQKIKQYNLQENKSALQIFGQHVFNRETIKKMLPKDICQNLLGAMDGKEKIKPEYADTIAVAMKEWAVNLGATHYTHWFQPLTGTAAEKHDAFIDWSGPFQMIEKFSGTQLLQGEPDASSFPSGGLRSTYEARGYTGWDPTSPVFIWEGGDGVTLCIPSVFFSWTGAVLDYKIPFHRSEKKINDAASRLLKLFNIPGSHVFSTLGCEQEYFVIDRALRNLRPDLVLLGKTVCGAPSPKGQELQDHYFGSVKDRILSYMRDFEDAALKLSIPVKTRHNEVAPAQHEVAPVFEKTSLAIDHNIMLMEIMRQIATKHNLACLLHEKPFGGLNGSGKHCNWSLSTDEGINLLNPTDTPGESLHFLVLITAILNAVHQHSALLRASIGSASNDYRLGGHEAPPAIISVYLGEELEQVLENIENIGEHKNSSKKDKYNLGLLTVPELSKDNTDRNRTSPFAFTGNKFEFRAVGSSSNTSFPITVLNTIVAESLNQILDEIEEAVGKNTSPSLQDLAFAAVPIIRKYLKNSKDIRFSGDNYSENWKKLAEKRKLPNLKKCIYAYESFKDEKSIKAFRGVLSKEELFSRYEILLEIYCHNVNIEANLIVDIAKNQLLPAAIRYQKQLAESIDEASEVLGDLPLTNQVKILKNLSELIEQGYGLAESLEEERAKAFSDEDIKARARAYCDIILEKIENLRGVLDKLETVTDDQLWPLPKYRELLFIV